jgi:hypothetical protein
LITNSAGGGSTDRGLLVSGLSPASGSPLRGNKKRTATTVAAITVSNRQPSPAITAIAAFLIGISF